MLESPAPPFPHLALLVSGGHTMLIEVRAIGDYRLLGQTRDDAAGEAFDKTAKLLGLPYPGGPQLAQLASAGARMLIDFRDRCWIGRDSNSASRDSRPRSCRQCASGGLAEQARADVAHAVQDAIVDTLCAKTLRALEHTGHQALVVAGGVGANRELRARLTRERGHGGVRSISRGSNSAPTTPR